MTCTYYGGTTAEFVASILSRGVRPWDPENDNRRFLVGDDSNPYFLYQVGAKVMVSTNHRLSAPLLGVDADCERPVPSIDVQFLATCKLLDLAAYQAALANNLSPIALQIAIQSAKKTMKPDYPSKRKGGTLLTDFIEELVYFDLVQRDAQSPEHGEVFFTTPNYFVRSYSGTGGPNLGVYMDDSVNSRYRARKRLTKDAYIYGNTSNALEISYFDAIGLIEQSRFTDLLTIMTPPEAFQHAVREKLGYIVLDAATLDLPSGLMDE